VAEAEHAVGVDLRRVVHLQAEIGHGFRDEAITDEREEHGQPVPHEAPAAVRVEGEGEHREEERAGRQHPAPVDRAERGDEREHEGDHGEAAAESNRSRLLRGSPRVEEERQPVERAQDDAQAVHAVRLRFSMWAWPSARSRPRIHQATSA
jgi:hypothetical protein